MVALAALVRRHGPASRAPCADRRPHHYRAALAAMAPCRPEALGGPGSPCAAGGARASRSHACTNRHGPTGQNDATTRWRAPQRALLLPVPSLLVPLTRPEARRPVARSPQTRMAPLLLPSAAAWKALALAPPYLGGQRGLGGGLHPWTRALASHPPVPSRVPGGALAPAGSTGRTPRSAAWLGPVHALSSLFRGPGQAALTTAGFCDPVPPQVWTPGWVTQGPPAGPGTHVLTSVAPSLYRIASPNTRLAKLADGAVTCRVKERPRHAWTPRTLPAAECLRRCLQHGWPTGFPHVRSYGVLSPSRRPALAPLRTRLAAGPSHDQVASRRHPRDRHETAPASAAARPCRSCGGPLVCLFRLLLKKSRPP